MIKTENKKERPLWKNNTFSPVFTTSGLSAPLLRVWKGTEQHLAAGVVSNLGGVLVPRVRRQRDYFQRCLFDAHF